MIIQEFRCTEIDTIAQGLAVTLGAPGVEIVPCVPHYQCDLSAAALRIPGEGIALAFGRMRHTRARVTITTDHVGVALGFEADGAVFAGVNPPSGPGVTLAASVGPHVVSIPERCDFIGLYVGAPLLRGLSRTFGPAAMPPEQAARLIAWSSRRRTERATRRLWARFSRPAGDGGVERLEEDELSGDRFQGVIAEIEDALFEDLEACVEGGPTVRREISETLVAHCQEILLAVRTRPVSTRELADLTGATQQRINDSFKRELGMGPRDWHRLQRLGHVRAALQSARTYSVKVGEVARWFGFDHLGRFSEAYRSIFREYPSATLKNGTPVGIR